MKEEEAITEDDAATDTLPTGPLTPPEGEAATQDTAKPATFKVKLKATKDGAQAVSGFTYPVREQFKSWSLERHGLEVEFDDLEAARSFMATAVETGALEVAGDSPIRLRDSEV